MQKKINFSSCYQKPSSFSQLQVFQHNLLVTDVNFEKFRLKKLKKEFHILHNEFRSVLDCIGFTTVSSLFLMSNDAILNAHYSVQKKQSNVRFKNIKPKLDSDKVILNYSKASVSDAEKYLLVKRLCFSLSPKKFNYVDYLTSFELFFQMFVKQRLRLC